MADLLVRSVPEEVVRFYRLEAKRHHRSMQQQLLETLQGQATEALRRDRAIAEARAMREAIRAEGVTAAISSDSVRLLREDRAR